MAEAKSIKQALKAAEKSLANEAKVVNPVAVTPTVVPVSPEITNVKEPEVNPIEIKTQQEDVVNTKTPEVKPEEVKPPEIEIPATPIPKAASKEQILSTPKTIGRPQPPDVPPPILGKNGDTVLITLNDKGNIANVEFTGTSYMIATLRRVEYWCVQIQNYARMARSKANTAKLDEEMKQAKKG